MRGRRRTTDRNVSIFLLSKIRFRESVSDHVFSTAVGGCPLCSLLRHHDKYHPKNPEFDGEPGR